VFENTVNKKRNIKNFIKLVHEGITKEDIYKFDEVELLEFIRRVVMIQFKCRECGELQYSSNIEIAPCIKCGGKIEVDSLEEVADENRDENISLQ